MHQLSSLQKLNIGALYTMVSVLYLALENSV